MRVSTVSELTRNGEYVLNGLTITHTILKSPIITKNDKKIPIPHPGEILIEEFLKPLKITSYRLAKDISVPPIRISEIIRGKRAVSADTALRFARYFGTSADFWLNLQDHYDLEVRTDLLKDRLNIEVKVLAEAKRLRH